MKMIVFCVMTFMVIALCLAGCAFDKFRLSVDRGELNRSPGGLQSPSLLNSSPSKVVSQ